MTRQTRRGAMIETATNLAIGFSAAWLINFLLLNVLHMPPTVSTITLAGLLVTIASVIRSYGVRRLFEALRIRKAPPDFIYIVEEFAAERLRQILGEGYDLTHDDKYTRAELQRAAGWYALASASYPNDSGPLAYEDLFHDRNFGWPWDGEFWKSESERRDMIKSGALLVAAIGRLDRERARRVA